MIYKFWYVSYLGDAMRRFRSFERGSPAYRSMVHRRSWRSRVVRTEFAVDFHCLVATSAPQDKAIALTSLDLVDTCCDLKPLAFQQTPLGSILSIT